MLQIIINSLWKLPLTIIKFINTAFHFFTATMVVLYGIMTGAPSTVGQAEEDQQRAMEKNQAMNDFYQEIDDGASQSTIDNRLNGLKREFDLNNEEFKEIKQSSYRQYYHRRIKEFVDFNEDLTNESNRRRKIKEFDNLLRESRDYFNEEELKDRKQEYLDTLVANARAAFNAEAKEIADMKESAIKDDIEERLLKKAREFFQDLDYDASAVTRELERLKRKMD